MNVNVLLGAPGSGKGTQAKRLADSHQFIHLSTGDMLREAIRLGTEVGLRAKAFMDRGDLVPDKVIIEIIEDSLARLESSARVLLDGCVRTVPQAQALEASSGVSVHRAVYFRIPFSVLVARLTGRRTCTQCGEPFHVRFMPPKKEGVCDRCGGPLVQRPDDAESVVKHRLEVFLREIDSLLHFFRENGKLVEINADRSVEEVQAELLRAVL